MKCTSIACAVAKIVVTCNPSHSEGDFRTFEALASGALVFVDEDVHAAPSTVYGWRACVCV